LSRHLRLGRFVALFGGEFEQLERIADFGFELLDRVELGDDRRAFAQQGLRLVLVVPEVRRARKGVVLL